MMYLMRLQYKSAAECDRSSSIPREIIKSLTQMGSKASNKIPIVKKENDKVLLGEQGVFAVSLGVPRDVS